MNPAARTHDVPPLRTARLILLGLLWAFAVVAASVGLDAVIQGERDKTEYKRLAPPGVAVDVDTNDIFTAGCCVAVAAALIAVVAFGFAIHTLIASRSTTTSRSSLRIQAFLLALITSLLLGSMIAFEIFFCTRSANVKAFIGSSPIPDSVIQRVAESAGVSGVYKDKHYLRLVAILPWFSIFAALATIAVLFAASKGPSSSSSSSSSSIEHAAPFPTSDSDEKEKEETEPDPPGNTGTDRTSDGAQPRFICGTAGVPF